MCYSILKNCQSVRAHQLLLTEEEQPCRDSASVVKLTHIGRSVGADVSQDGLHVGDDVFFGHVEL